MSFNFLTFRNCDVRLKIILFITFAIFPILRCAKLENPQIRLLINDDDLLQEKSNIHEAGTAAEAVQRENSGEHFNFYRSELKRLSYETIHRILRDENEPSYRREDTELRYYQKRSPSYEENHQLFKRSAQEREFEFNSSKQNLTEFPNTPQVQKQLNKISILDLSDNYISKLNISLLDNCTSLRVLNLKNNSFTFIPLKQETALRTLNLNHNLIRTSSLTSNIYLRNLYLSGNLIENFSSMQLSLLKNLETLDISHNLLKNVESSFFTERMHNLKHLNLAFNRLGSIYRETFYNLLSLNTLLLSHNNISDIDYETFLALPNLQYLDLSFNKLQGKSIRALQGITGLVALNIAFNPDIGPYMQEFVASWSLKQLDASGTGLCQIPAALAQSVRFLKLTHNWLKIINCGDLDSYPLLQYLDLSFSHIEHIEDDALGRLEILEILMLDHNKLQKIPYSLPVSLEHLFLQHNDIMDVPQQAFLGLNNLRTLDLSHNKILYLPDIMLPKLQILNLQASDIKGISQGIIHSLPKLNDLMLEDNPIKCADLLGIAEWASTCRLRVEKEVEIEAEHTTEEVEEEFKPAVRGQDLKTKYDKMHNFYEQFGLNTSLANETLLSQLKAPTCVQENLSTLQHIQKSEKIEKDKGKELKINQNLNEIKSTTFKPSLATEDGTEKSFGLKFHTRTDAERKNTVRREEQKIYEEFADENPKGTNTRENAAQIVGANMQSSISNEKQPTTSILTKFNPNITTYTAVVATTTSSNINVNFKMRSAANEGQSEKEIIAKPRLTNERKTLDHLSKTTDARRNQEQDKIAPTKSSFKVTKLIEAVSKRTKETHQQLADVQFTNTFQTTKSKKWLKQEASLKGGSEGISPNKDISLNRSNVGNTTATQFIKSTTFATAINSKLQITTNAAPRTLLIDESTTAVPIATTKMNDAVTQLNQDNAKNLREKLKEEDVKFERTTSKLEINVEFEKQQHEIKAEIPTTENINSLAKQTPKSMQTKIAATTATSNKRMAEITLKIPQELTTNKELYGFPYPASANVVTTLANTNNKILTTTTSSSTIKPAIKEKHKLELAATIAAPVLKTFKTIQPNSAGKTKSVSAETTTTSTVPFKDEDLASIHNDNVNNRQTTTTMNATSNILVMATDTTATTTTIPAALTHNSSSNNNSEDNKNNQISKKFNITTTAANRNTVLHQQQPPLLLNMMSNYRQSSQNDVNVKCVQSNSNECNTLGRTAAQRPNEIGRTPTIEATLEQTTASKTSTEIPEAVAAVTIATTTMIHKHEPLQLLVKDRHLIGTPLLMHKGENLMVTADELILPTNNNNNAKQEDNSSNNRNNSNNKELENSEAKTMANVNKNKYNLETSQTTKLATTTVAPPNAQALDEQRKTHKSIDNKKDQDHNVAPGNLLEAKNSNFETETKNPSLIMKKMTIVTKQHEESQPAVPLENEVHAKQFVDSHYQELKPVTINHETSGNPNQIVRHNTVNTPISGKNLDKRLPYSLLKQPHTFENEHELLIQQILQDQEAETHAKLTKSEQWSDLRKAENKVNHPGLILLVSSGLFLVLLLGLVHVYRCDMPWRRYSPSQHMRPHQRQSQSLEDDSHSFLSYSEGMQKWHHSTRLEAPYNSPLHNLHVRELQRTSATEKAATVKSSVSKYNSPPLSHSIVLENSRSSTTITSTASASSSAILDDESFYIEMTPDSGQLASALESELLPMELLNMSPGQMLGYQDIMGDTQTSMEEECVVRLQQQQRHPSLTSSLSATAGPTCSTSPAITTTSLTVKPQSQARKFGLW